MSVRLGMGTQAALDAPRLRALVRTLHELILAPIRKVRPLLDERGGLFPCSLNEPFEPLITVGDDNILYMSVGLIDIDEDEPGMVDHPVFFCPFCGKEIQDADEVRDKLDALEGS